MRGLERDSTVVYYPISYIEEQPGVANSTPPCIEGGRENFAGVHLKEESSSLLCSLFCFVYGSVVVHVCVHLWIPFFRLHAVRWSVMSGMAQHVCFLPL
jgi:hypothetical protein